MAKLFFYGKVLGNKHCSFTVNNYFVRQSSTTISSIPCHNDMRSNASYLALQNEGKKSQSI